MGRKHINPDIVKPIFDLDQQHPFLLRPLTGYEKSVVGHFRNFYRSRIANSGRPTSEFRDEFIKQLIARGFAGYLFRRENGTEDRTLFQNLFKSKPDITLLPAMSRIVGLHHVLTESELRDGFRELVEIHKNHTGKYLSWADMARYHKQRLFLPKTGILAPDPLRYQKRAKEIDPSAPTHGVSFFYRAYFEIPREISTDDFAKIEAGHWHSLEDLIDNLRKVQKWMLEVYPNVPGSITPSRVDIESYANNFEDGISWNVYESWLYHGTELATPTPHDAVRSLDWLREQCGFDEARTFQRRSKSNPRGFWTPEKIRESFCEAWRIASPSGFRPSFRILADPPTLQTIERMAREQALILDTFGFLDTEVCQERSVPCSQIPSVSTIKERYPGGFQKLLADIEMRYRPDGGIQFSSGVQLTRLAHMHNKSNSPDRFAPVQVAKKAGELLSIK